MAKHRPKSQMTVWRPIHSRLWNDRRFLSMSDRGRLLWLYMLSAPSTPIPGVLITGRARAAEDLNWSPQGVGEGVSEIERTGMQFRWQGRLLWLVNSIKHQPVAGPNAIRAWAVFWDDIPNEPIKHELWQALEAATKRWSKVFREEIREPLSETLPPIPSPNPSPQGIAYTNTTTNTTTSGEEIGAQGAHDQLDRFKAKVDAAATKAKRYRGTQLPADWHPRDEERAWCRDNNVDCDAEAEAFRDHHRARGTTFRDWHAGFRTWLRNHVKWRKPQPKQQHLGVVSDALLRMANGDS